MISPRVTFSRMAPSGIRANISSSNIARVSAVSGSPTASTSLVATTSRSDSGPPTVSTPSPGGTGYRSMACTSMPNAAARRAMCRPVPPNPKMPIVRPSSSSSL